MFDRMHTNEYLDEEQYAQRYGRVVGEHPLWNQVWVQVGELLIGIGEKLKAENAPVKWEKETV